MQYRAIPASGVKLSSIGLGGMHISKVSDEQAVATVRRAVELGVNYLETAPGYGDSEVKIGKAIKGIRDRVYVSTKSVHRDAPDTDGVRRAIEASMKRLQVDHIDFYHMWYVCSEEDWRAVMKKGGHLDGARRAKAEGLISHIGITTHAPAALVKEMIECGEYELVTLTYNVAQRRYEETIDLAGKRGVGIVTMNPLAGGLLARQFDPKAAGAAVAGAAVAGAAGVVGATGPTGAAGPRPHVMAALGFLMSNPYITTAICGAKSPVEIEEDAAAGEFLPTGATGAGAVDLGKLDGKFCTTCGYCMPCPNGVNIPHMMLNWNYWRLYDLDLASWDIYARRELLESSGGGNCTGCGECLRKCPNALPIVDRLRELKEVFRNGAP